MIRSPYQASLIPKIVVLIDAENISAKLAPALFREIESLGEIQIARFYADLGQPHVSGWMKERTTYNIRAIDQPRHTAGKSISDLALVIGAMDLLHEQKFDVFCLVSSDGDFAPLATRLREAGATVYGFGENKTPSHFTSVCNKFIVLTPPETKDSESTTEQEASVKQVSQQELVDLLGTLIDQFAEVDGWVNPSTLKHRLLQQCPTFRQSSDNRGKFTNLLRGLGFDVENRSIQPGKPQQPFVRRPRRNGMSSNQLEHLFESPSPKAE